MSLQNDRITKVHLGVAVDVFMSVMPHDLTDFSTSRWYVWRGAGQLLAVERGTWCRVLDLIAPMARPEKNRSSGLFNIFKSYRQKKRGMLLGVYGFALKVFGFRRLMPRRSRYR